MNMEFALVIHREKNESDHSKATWRSAARVSTRYVESGSMKQPLKDVGV